MRKEHFNHLLQLVSSRFGVDKKDILKDNRHKEIVEARAILSFILRSFGYSYPRIGRMLHRDHTSIIHLCKIVESNPVSKQIAEEIKGNLGNQELPEEYKGIRYWGKWKEFYETYEAKCQICGIEDIVELHHKIPLRNGGSNNPENLLILCPTHHTMLHLGLLKLKNIPPLKLVNKDDFPPIKKEINHFPNSNN